MHLFLCTVLILTVFLTGSRQSKVFWELSSTPAYFRKNVRLFCNLSSFPDCCMKKMRRWNGGKTQEAITFNELSFFPSKYTSEIASGGFYLEIKNFSASDVNIPYTCSYGVQQQKRVLHLDENFISYPQVKRLFNYSQNGVEFMARLSRVFPSPNCSAVNNEKDISSALSIDSSTEDVFYNTNVSLTNTALECGNLIISCALGHDEIIVINRTIDKCSQHSENTTDMLLLIVGISLVLILISQIAVISYKVGEKTRRHGEPVPKDDSKNKETMATLIKTE